MTLQSLLQPALLTNEWFALVCVGLAAWRVSHMLVWETGPWLVFQRLRARFGVLHDYDNEVPVSWPDGSIFKCVWCMSVWVTLVFCVLPVAVGFVFAASAVACVLQEVVDRGES